MLLRLLQRLLMLLTLGSTFSLLAPTAQAQTAPTWSRITTLNSAGSQGYGSTATDAAGNTYVLGTFTVGVTLGGRSYASQGQGDVLLVKYDPQGQVLWARTGGSSGTDGASALLLDGNGGVYITGFFDAATALFGPVTLTRAGSRGTAGYVVKYDEQGTVVWGLQLGTNYSDQGKALALAPNGDLFVGGWFSTTVQMANGGVLIGQGGADGFVVRVSPAGTVLSGFSIGSAENEEVRNLAVDAAGNLYVSGYFSLTITAGSLSLTSRGYSDAFVIKYSPQGTALWAWQLGGVGGDLGLGLSLAPGGDVVLVGQFDDVAYYGVTPTAYIITSGSSDSFTARLDGQGQARWVRAAGSPFDDSNQHALADAAGRVYVSGYHSPRAVFGSSTFATAGMHLVSYDAQGQVLWAKDVASATSGGLSPGPLPGQLFVSGGYGSQSSFSPLPFPSADASGDAFLAVLGGLTTATRPARSLALEVYPNPVRGQLWVRGAAPGPLTLRLLTLQGRCVLTRALPSTASGPAALSLAGVPAGGYLLQWQDARGSGSRLVTVEP